jgi:hypothetical protein
LYSPHLDVRGAAQPQRARRAVAVQVAFVKEKVKERKL